MQTQRRIGAIVLACMVAGLLALAGLLVWLGPGPGLIVAAGIAFLTIATYVFVIGPWQRRWGATDEEVRRPMPGDELLRAGASSTTRAITVDRAPHDVFPWLLQIGYGRGGWYSYDWIDNDGKPSVDHLDPALRSAVGDRIEMMPGLGPVIRAIEPDHVIVSGGDADSWCLSVEPTQDGKTRLISRWRQDWPRTAATYVWIALADPGAFIMERKMLRTIRDRAERGSTVPIT